MSRRRGTCPQTLMEERQLFEALRDTLLRDGKEGQYVLFKGGKVEGYFSSEQEAYEVGLDRYGLTPFLVDLVTRHSPDHMEPWLQDKTG